MLLRKADPMNDSIDDPVPDRTKLITLDNDGARSSVQFKPSKKMKKRRQLDALVANEKKLPRRKHSGHELLRASNDSGSSEVEEFSILHGHKWDKSWTFSSCCFTCYTLTCVLLVTSCLLACATLVWMHLELKRDFNDLRDRLERVENKNAGTPEEFQALQSKLTLMNKSLNDIQTGKHGLQSLNKSIVSMQAQIASLTTTQHQQQQISNSDDKNHKDVTNTVADLGSGLQSTQSDVKTLKASQKTFSTQLEDLNNRVSVLENPHGREGGDPVFDATSLQTSVAQINSTLTQSITKAVMDLNKQQTHIEALSQFTQELQSEVRNTHQLAVNLTQSQQRLQESLSQHDTSTTDAEELTQLQDQVNQLQLSVQQLLVDQSNVTEAESSSSVSSSPSSSGAGDFHTLIKDHEDFVHFRSEVFQDINSLNATVVSLNETIGVLKKDVGDLTVRISFIVHNISSIATVVGGITSSVNSNDANTELAMGSNSNSQADQPGHKGGYSPAGQTSHSENEIGKNVQSTTSAASQSEQPHQQSNSDSDSSQHPAR